MFCLSCHNPRPVGVKLVIGVKVEIHGGDPDDHQCSSRSGKANIWLQIISLWDSVQMWKPKIAFVIHPTSSVHRANSLTSNYTLTAHSTFARSRTRVWFRGNISWDLGGDCIHPRSDARSLTATRRPHISRLGWGGTGRVITASDDIAWAEGWAGSRQVVENEGWMQTVFTSGDLWLRSVYDWISPLGGDDDYYEDEDEGTHIPSRYLTGSTTDTCDPHI